MNNEGLGSFLFFIFVAAVGCCILSFGSGRIQGVKEMEIQAVKAGVGDWYVNKSGCREFKWKK